MRKSPDDIWSEAFRDINIFLSYNIILGLVFTKLLMVYRIDDPFNIIYVAGAYIVSSVLTWVAIEKVREWFNGRE